MGIISKAAKTLAGAFGERAVLDAAIEGTGYAASKTAQGAKILGSASWKGTKALGSLAKKNPYKLRTLGVGSAAIASTSLLGFAGVGPLSGVGDEYERYMTSMYGDNDETRRVINTQQFVAGAAGFVAAATGGAAIFGKGPLGFAKNQTVKGAVGSAAKKIVSPFNELYESSKSYNFDWNKKLPPQPNWGMEKIKSAARVIKNPTNPENFYLKKPVRWGLAAGFVGGIGVGLTEQEPYGGFEGNIQGISSSQGGISEDLQFSTQDLMFSLHNINKNYRRRYQ